MVKGMTFLGYLILWIGFSTAFGLPYSPYVQENRALNRAAYHSSTIDYFQTGHLATDGQKETFWESSLEDGEWVYVDLGKIFTVEKVVLRWEGNLGSSYLIQTSIGKKPFK